MGDYSNLYDKLAERGLRASQQRIRVLEYLCRGETHPTADAIYKALAKELPSLSKATVYNALNALVGAGLAKEISTEDKEARFDATTNCHGHFKCDECGRIYNFQIDIEDFKAGGLDGFKVNTKDVYFRGKCRDCTKMNEGGQ